MPNTLQSYEFFLICTNFLLLFHVVTSYFRARARTLLYTRTHVHTRMHVRPRMRVILYQMVV